MKGIKEVQLEQKYGLSVATAMVIGIVVGIGIFFKAEAILKAASLNPTVAIVAWVLGGTITILAGLTAAELGAAIPETGGLVAYIRRIYGDFAGFMTGWMHVVLYLPGLVAVLAYYTGFFATIFLGIESTPTNVAMISIPAFLSVFVINLFMAKSGGRLQTVITAIKIIPLAGLLIFGLLNGSNPTPFSVAEGVSSPFSMSLVLAALVPVMFAYDGWMLACSIGGEIKNPTKNLPKAIIFGLGLIIVLYVGLNIALLKTLPANLLAEQGTVGAANLLFGPMATKAIFGGIVISAYGTLNGLTLAAIRFPYTLAIEGHFPMKNYFSEVSTKFNTPLKSGFLMFIISGLYLLAPFVIDMSIDIFADIPVAIIWAFYSVLFIGLIILRKKEPNLDRPYKVPLYPIIPILAAIGGIGITISATINQPHYMLYSIIIVLLGVPFYRKNR
ncbi:MAG: amino acid permease [Psychrilyobacter sp.]|uniref:APC family permease n=1 Tax=Psychrilyobacter sp. TaxID=2586924 RepID=UPI003C72F0BA